MADKLLSNAPVPIRNVVLDKENGLFSQPWQEYLSRLPPTLEAIPSRLNFVTLSRQLGSLSATDFSTGALLHGLYRLTYAVRVTSTSGGGSLRVTFRWTDGGVACSFQGFPFTLSFPTGNLTSGTISESTMVRSDKETPITYETTFSGATEYNLDVTLEKMALL